MYSSIYVIVNKINGKMYVGKANDPTKRWERHRENWVHKRFSHYPLYRAMLKYGKVNFSFHVIEEFDNEPEALEAEVWWISYFKSIGAELYNCTPGGDGWVGIRHKESTKRKMSKTHKKKASRAHFAYENTIAY